MSNLSTLPKGDSAWLLRKAIERIIQQVSVLETNIGSSTTGNSNSGEVIFNDAGVLRGDSGLTFNSTTDTLRAGLLIVPGNTQLATVGILYVGSLGSPKLKVDVAGTGETTIASATITGDLTAQNNIYVPGNVSKKIGPVGSTWGGLRFDSTNQPFLDSDIGITFRTGGSTSFTTSYVIGATGISTWSVGGSTAMTLNSTGLGVGVVPSTYKLEVGNGSVDARALFKSNNAFSIGVQNGASGIGGWIGSTGNNILTFSGNDGTMKVTISDSGNVGVGVTPSGSGGCLQLKSGITFPATQVASSDANTLDDYEEGTWVGTLKGGTTDPTTPITATGRYTKVGRLVTLQINFENVNTTGASGKVFVSGIPFTNGGFYTYGNAASYVAATFSGTLTCVLDASEASSIVLFDIISNAAWATANHNAGSGRFVRLTITYTVN